MMGRRWRSWGLPLALGLMLGCSAEQLQSVASVLEAPGAARPPTGQAPSAQPPVVGALPVRSPLPTLAPDGRPSLEPGVQVAAWPGGAVGGGGDRQERDQPDDEAGAMQLHVLYVVPAGNADARRDTDGSLARSVEAAAAWFQKLTGNRQGLRVDRHQGAIDVTYVPLKQITEAQLLAHGIYQRDALETALKDLGFQAPNKLYAAYVEGSHPRSCADAPSPPGLAGNVVALYLQAVSGGIRCIDNRLSPDGRQAGYLEHSLVHEVVHAVGFVPTCAPHRTANGAHTSYAPSDLMYAGNQPWRPTQLDGAGEFYRHGRSDCLDLARSAILSPAEGGGEYPPRWQEGLKRRYP